MKFEPTNTKLFILLAAASGLCHLWQNSAWSQGSATYPYVSPTAAASGMTSGLENGSTAATINMMQVRAAAKDSERAAAAAAMARTAEEALEEQNLNKALQEARERRQKKIEISEQLKWKRASAYNAYNKVSSSEMSTWKDAQGNVKIGREPPPEFVQAVREQDAARAAAASEQEKGFKPLKKISNKVNEVISEESPLQETGLSGPKPMPPAASPEAERRGLGNFIPKIRAPKIPNPFSRIGNRDPETPAPPQPQQQTMTRQTAPPPAQYASAPAPSPSSAVQPSSQATATPVQSPPTSAPRPQTQSPPVQTAPPKKIGGLFSRNKSSGQSDIAAGPSSNRLFGFGKKSSPPQPTVNNSLFPSAPGAPPQTTSSSSPQSNPKPTIVSLPRSTPPVQAAPKPKKKFGLPLPKLPSPGRVVNNGGGGVPSTTTVNQNGNSYYVVTGNSQFMKYGDTPTKTIISALSPGTVVEMTKPGADWASVRLSDGASGIIETRNLRPASGNDLPRR